MDIKWEGRFQSFEQIEDCQAFVAYLLEPETLIRMEMAVYYGKTPLSALVPVLKERFGHRFEVGDVFSKTQVDEFKQFCGHMVRQVLEGTGRFVYVKSGAKVKEGLFSTASVFAFRN